MTNQNGELVDIESVDWEDVFDFSGNKPHQPTKRSNLEPALAINVDGADLHEGDYLLKQAIDRGLIESVQDGYIHADYRKQYEEEYDENSSESPSTPLDAGNSSGNSQRTDNQKSASAEAAEPISQETQETINRLETRVDGLANTVENLDVKCDVAIHALKTAMGVQEDVPLAELVDKAKGHQQRFKKLKARAERTEKKLDDMGDFGGSDSITMEQRITAIRKELVRMNGGNARKRGMDLNSVENLMSGMDQEISSSYACKLVKAASEGHPAFSLKKYDDSRPQKVVVDLSMIPEDSVYREKRN